MPTRRKLAAHVLPILVFISFLALNGVAKKIDSQFWLTHAEYWIYPVQTILCGGLLIWFRREYDLGRPRRAVSATLVALVAFGLWVSPQAFFGAPPRLGGFSLDLLRSPALYWSEVILRFVRLIIVVPLVEEIFWRSFLLRFFINENFDQVRFGTFSWFSFTLVTLGFALSHSAADWIPALASGALYNAVAYRTKTLSSCIFAHALTNLLLGVWIVETKQWGFW
jgi:CAAX prenyl protease-like protein